MSDRAIACKSFAAHCKIQHKALLHPAYKYVEQDDSKQKGRCILDSFLYRNSSLALTEAG